MFKDDSSLDDVTLPNGITSWSKVPIKEEAPKENLNNNNNNNNQSTFNKTNVNNNNHDSQKHPPVGGPQSLPFSSPNGSTHNNSVHPATDHYNSKNNKLDESDFIMDDHLPILDASRQTSSLPEDKLNLSSSPDELLGRIELLEQLYLAEKARADALEERAIQAERSLSNMAYNLNNKGVKEESFIMFVLRPFRVCFG